jgi:hypothetical protein
LKKTWKVKGRGLYNDVRVQSSKYFIEHNCVSCGWGYPAIQNPNTVVDFLSYKQAWLDMYGKDRNWNYQGVHHLFESVQKGDFLWTRLDGEYYVAEVPDHPVNLFQVDLSLEAKEKDSVVQISNIHWKKCGTEDTVPGSISTFSSNRNAIVRVDNRETAQNGYSPSSLFSKSVLYPGEVELVKDRKMILQFIGPSGLEDLIALWLYDNYQYVVIPSTNKKSTQTYEFVLVDGSKKDGKYNHYKRIYIQAKNGDNDLKFADYSGLLNDGDEVWLVTSFGKIIGPNNEYESFQIMQYIREGSAFNKNGYPIEELIDFIFDQNKREILPESLTTWLSMFK